MLFNYKVKKDISKKTFVIAVIVIVLIVSVNFLFFGYKYLGFFRGNDLKSSTYSDTREETEKVEKFEYEIKDDGAVLTKYNGEDKEVVLPDKFEDKALVSIGEGAFAGNEAITSVDIPDSVTIIDTEAFFNCTALKTVSFPESLVTIAVSAFEGCELIEEIKLPSKVNYIGDGAFYNCSALSSITISDNLLYFGSNVFAGTAWYGTIKSGMVAIGNVLYMYNGAMPENYTLQIPDSIKTIASNAFSGYKNLTGISFGSSVKNICAGAFSYCTGLTSLVIPEGVRIIDDGAFNECSSITSVSIPASITKIGIGAFFDCASLSTVTVDEKNTYFTSKDNVLYSKDFTRLLIYCPKSPAAEYTMPETVVSVDNGAFYGSTRLTSATLSKSLCALPAYAFFGCTSLKSITIPDSVVQIGDMAFLGCKNLVLAELPAKLEKIGYSVFTSCSSLDGFVIADSCEDFTVVNGVLFSKDMKTLYAYPNGNKSTSYTVPDGVEQIGVAAFISSMNLTEINLPASLKQIFEEAFAGCTKLVSLTVPDNVTQLGSYCFAKCSMLKSVFIGKSVISIGNELFDGCYSLVKIGVGEGNTKFVSDGSVLYNSGKTILYCYPASKSGSEFSLPDTVKTVSDYAFFGCAWLEKVTFPASAAEISANSFAECSKLKEFAVSEGNAAFSAADGVLFSADGAKLLKYPSAKTGKSYTVPDSVSYIRAYAFEECSNLTTLNVGSLVTNIDSYAVYKSDRLKIICPKNSNIQKYAEYFKIDYEFSD